jgi:4-amino-4-deoxy-L-arabinose transferase-like glycosyltransferase
MYTAALARTFGIRSLVGIRTFHVTLWMLPALIATFLLASRLFGDGPGVIALLSLSTSWYFFQEASFVKLDVPLATLSTIFFLLLYEMTHNRNPRTIQLQIGCSAAVILACLTKYQGILIPLTGVLYLLSGGQKNRMENRCRFRIGWIIASVVVAYFVWTLIALLCGDNLGADLVRNLGRISHQRYHPLFSVPLLDFWIELGRKMGAILLWFGFVLSVFAWRSRFFKDSRLRLIGLWLLIVLVFCSSISLRTPRYSFAAFPALAVLTGALFSTETWTTFFSKPRRPTRLILIFRVALLCMVVAASIFVTGRSIVQFSQHPRITYYEDVGLAIKRLSSKRDRILIYHPQYAYYSERDYFYNQYIPSSTKWIELVSNPANKIQIFVLDRRHDFFYFKMPPGDRLQIQEYVITHFVRVAGVHFRGELYRRTKW